MESLLIKCSIIAEGYYNNGSPTFIFDIYYLLDLSHHVNIKYIPGVRLISANSSIVLIISEGEKICNIVICMPLPESW